MNDTPPDIEVKLNAMFMRRSSSDRVRMACEMFDLARTLMIASIRVEHPDITGAALRARLFDRLYGDDFTPQQRARIVARLSRLVESPKPNA